MKKRLKTKIVLEEPKIEVPKEPAVEVKTAEARLICSKCGGEYILLRKSDNQTMYECSKCKGGLTFC